MFAVNTLGPFYFSRAVVRSWLDLPVAVSGGGQVDVTKIKNAKLDKQILFISSISGLVAMSPQRQAAYNASKGGLTMLAKVRLSFPYERSYSTAVQFCHD
jgi:NAD(P)-dependent dehydrogenase (short-subunit alcohol dehydrogenase family)